MRSALTLQFYDAHFFLVTLIALELLLRAACTLTELGVKFMMVFMLLTW
jgi:hypothetical protein